MILAWFLIFSKRIRFTYILCDSRRWCVPKWLPLLKRSTLESSGGHPSLSGGRTRCKHTLTLGISTSEAKKEPATHQIRMKISKLLRFSNFCPNDSKKRAFESWDPKLLQFEHFIMIGPHILSVFNNIEEVWIMWFFMFFKKSIFDPSSIPSQIKGDWGRIKFFQIFEKYKF